MTDDTRRGPAARPPGPRPIRAGYRILGVDPGTRLVGYGALELDARQSPSVLGHGVCRLSPRDPVATRLGELFVALQGFVDQLRPDVVVVEDVFYGKNIQSALRIGESRGVILVVTALSGRELVEYPPSSVKRAVTGSGRASKQQVQGMVVRLLGLDRPPETSDASDALALALCHAHRIASGVRTPAPRKRRRAGRGPIDGKSLQALLDRIHLGGQGGQRGSS